MTMLELMGLTMAEGMALTMTDVSDGLQQGTTESNRGARWHRRVIRE